MGMELVEWTMGRHVLRLVACLHAADQVRGLEPVERKLLGAAQAVLPLYRSSAEVASFRQHVAAVLQAYAAAGARMAQAVALEHAQMNESDCVVRLPEAVVQRLVQLAVAAGDLEASMYLEAAL